MIVWGRIWPDDEVSHAWEPVDEPTHRRRLCGSADEIRWSIPYPVENETKRCRICLEALGDEHEAAKTIRRTLAAIWPRGRSVGQLRRRRLGRALEAALASLVETKDVYAVHVGSGRRARVVYVARRKLVESQGRKFAI